MEFYRQLKPIQDFVQIHDLNHFVEAPSDWMVLLSDVKGSTKAVQEGRAKDVNMLGASLITLISNETKTFNTISVFGGDGATILISREDFERLRKQFVGLIRLANDKFKIELRIGGVSIENLKKHGHQVLVGRYQVSEVTSLAQLAGSGVSAAETMVKEKHPDAINLSAGEEWVPPNLSGLSCRMNRMPNRNGRILSLILKGKTTQDSDWIRQSLVSDLKKILKDDFHTSNPVKASTLGWKWIPATLRTEIKLQSRSPKDTLRVIFNILLANFLIKLNISAGGFVPQRYKSEIPVNSDFKKFDDALRMVIDCSPEQIGAIRKLLESARAQGRIYYGLHESEGAVVTCMTMSASTGHHVHFVDGEGCGYSMASIQLKEQIKGSKS